MLIVAIIAVLAFCAGALLVMWSIAQPAMHATRDALDGWGLAEAQVTELIGYLRELKECAPVEFEAWAAERVDELTAEPESPC